MSSEIYELMKRSDEAHVVEKAHRRPRFVEDCVREMIRGVVDAFPDLDDRAFVSARQVNLETIHQHNVVAERFGTLGEVRDELARPASAGAPHEPPRLARRDPVGRRAAGRNDARRRPRAPGRAAQADHAPRPQAGARAAAAQGRRLRRVPHRPAPARPRDRGHQAPGRARPPDRRDAPRTAGASACRGSAGPTATCRYCTTGRENLCVNARFTGRDIDGGFAELTVADERYCLPLPDDLTDEQAAPLLCGGLIGYRALTLHRRRAAPRPVRLRLGRAHDLPGRRLPGPRGVRVHARRRRAHAGVRAQPRRELGRRQRRDARPSRSTPRSSSRPPASSSRRR